MAKRKASKRPRTMAEAVQISLSEVVQEDPTPRPLEDTQPSQVTQPSQAPHLPQPIQPPSNAPETSMKKCGRGSAKGIHQWGTGTKLKLMFNNDFQPLGDEGSRLKGQLGTMLRNPHRVPLTYLDWNSVPEEIKSAIWKEIEDNIEDCPAEFQPVAMRSCNKLWKDHKAKTKEKYYTKHEEDPDILLKVPKRVLPDQWKELVSYWRTMDAKLIATRNSKNREWRGPDHRTGRTHFSQIRHEMSANGENTDKMSVFIKTRDENDPDVKAVVEEFNQNLAEIPESLQTIEVRNKIFHDVLGEDGHGYCKTYGAGVLRSAVYGQSSRSPHASSSSNLNEITRQVREATQEIEQRLSSEIEQRLRREIEQRFVGEMERMLNEKLMAHLGHLKHVSDKWYLDGHEKVCLVSYTIPKHDVAEGIVVSKDPLVKVDGKPLGSDFWKVLVKKAKIPNASLERPRKKFCTIGEAVDCAVAWRSCDVFVEE
ncbi:hypothetical protein RHSIM_Rhsim01G0079900 [Rhododendron simsii]|uniref:Transposase Tnp1/En/Spm-like domain-containing protein n=1 Tax=Rhododendron simsii TaxID=118357 RepID=A0A834LUD8_RHOSS|nr:hypothetical protein RHSIM_Rhsim01G0079900 [Rhododendron simsii]